MTGIPETVVRLQAGELRIAWTLLVLLALIAFPGSSPWEPTPLLTVGLGFLPGALILARRTATRRVTSEVESLVANSVGRVSVALALAVAALVAVIFDVFVALFLVGLTVELMWLTLLVSPKASLARFFPAWALAAGTTLTLLTAADRALNWARVARRLGTPSERSRWRAHYSEAKEGNLFHFRSRYEDTRRRPGVRRIIALGDSFTEGYGIWSSDSTWPAQLEQELNRNSRGPPTEVIDMGRGGFTTGNEAEQLRRLGWQFDPDLVVVQWVSNDVNPTSPNLRIYGDIVHVVLIPPRFRTGLVRNSAIVFILERYLQDVLNRPMTDLYESQSPGWHELQAALKEMADSAARRCVPLIMVAYPYLFPGLWTSTTYPERHVIEMFTAAAQRAGTEVVDLLPTFAGANRPGQSWWAAPYDTHPNAAAQHLAALSIARFIRERRLLPDVPEPGARCKPSGKPANPATAKTANQ